MPDIKVLIVDEEAEFASTLAERLEIRGYQADSADCMKNALDRILANTPDVVVLDIQAQEKNSLDYVSTIKKAKPQAKIILLTEPGAINSGIDGVVRGAFDFLMKPVSIAELLEKIQQASGKSNQ